MNKKRLSVVMAGAMLASSVAPVLAAESYEVNGSNRGTLVKKLRELLQSKQFANIAANNDDKTLGTAHDYAGESVYKVEIKYPNKPLVKVYTVDATNIQLLEDTLNKAPKGTVVKVYDRGHEEKDGQYYAGYLADKEVQAIFTEANLSAIAKEFEDDADAARTKYVAIYNATYDKEKQTLTVEYRKAKDELSLDTLTYTVGQGKVNFEKPIDSKGNEIVTSLGDWSGVAGFKPVMAETIAKGRDIPEKLLATVTISDVDSKETVKLSDLYDGLLLTDKGNDLLAALKEYKAASKKNGIGGNINPTFVSTTKDLKIGNVSTTIVDGKNGIFTFDIELLTYSAKKDGTRDKVIEKNVVTVSSNNRAQLGLFQKWMANRKPQVDVLAGDNRYETAVNIAKENADITTVAENGNIVLVNGNALVDGLAAAPLAASVWNKDINASGDDDYTKVAPILLTESDELPKATKSYIKELIAEQRVGNLDKVTIYLVGGETVLSKSLENELKGYGLRVVRAGGDNREETSLKVAEVMLKDGNTSNVDVKNPFVVGADGEADAMSIAPVAAGAADATRIRPIIVESRNGLSEKALETIEDWKNDQYNTKAVTATIVGGKTVVSKETEELLVANDIKVDRVEGTNRQATNAAVIDRYYKDATVKQLVVAKDGKGNKSHLVDALTATSLAVKHKTPIVLGTDKLSETQINTLEKKSTKEGVYVYQVGIGVAKDVLRTIASRVGLVK